MNHLLFFAMYGWLILCLEKVFDLTLSPLEGLHLRVTLGLF
jgi:hypothetical protein